MNFVLALSLLWCGLALVGNAKQRIPALNSYDPGSCNKKTHGKEVLVKDRSDKEIILICVKDKGVYQWEPIDGSKNTIGEFFNPGLNCSDILDKLEDANDGFYWITLKRSSPIKVFCDMTTDAGGFMLIGRKTNSITWTVPSNNKTVGPYGDPHWSSSLGDAPILDFRVQMATKEDFKATKAHWFYRLLSKRPLKNLMMNTAGCDQRSAGIGNIAYVKDLLTENIVTTKLRCSKFGFAHHPLVKFGWLKMNSCLQKPCPWGFAFHDVVKHQVDFYGGFSFSTTRTISGMEYNATASVGCDNGYCCGCYGPVGGTKDYCAENCKAINGGTVTKNVFTWFWVRSSLPKRLWKKCMDYQVKRNDGKLISYKLVGHSVIPVEGTCSKDSTLLHDGIVVVPDSFSAQKVPAVDGLLEYRKDKKELYIRSNKTWNVLAQENKILEETNERNKLNLDKIKRLDQNLQNEKKIILQETNKKHQLNLDKINRLDQNLQNEKKIILQETNKKDKLNLDKIKKLEQDLNNEKKIVNQKVTKLENLIKKLSVSYQHKECFGYKWLRERNRNQKYLRREFKCDRSLSGWYRFGGGAGNKMPTSCAPQNRCGTAATGWINGAHPTVADGKVTRKVCYNWSGNCCWKSNNIQVVNCGLYYVYKLSKPPGCDLRYCGSDN